MHTTGQAWLYGIQGMPKMWLKSFPTERNQFIYIKDKNSCKQPIIHGVPQG